MELEGLKADNTTPQVSSSRLIKVYLSFVVSCSFTKKERCLVNMIAHVT